LEDTWAVYFSGGSSSGLGKQGGEGWLVQDEVLQYLHSHCPFLAVDLTFTTATSTSTSTIPSPVTRKCQGKSCCVQGRFLRDVDVHFVGCTFVEYASAELEDIVDGRINVVATDDIWYVEDGFNDGRMRAQR
jgi:hypothetical protein